MNADRLLEHFERISDAGDAVPRLRRFVLDLAVRGKLLPQDPAEAISSPGATSQDLPFAIPSAWAAIPLGDALHMINGRAFKPTDWLPKGLPIVRIQNLNNATAPFNFCNPDRVDERHLIDNDEFLISWSGTPGTSFGAFIWRRGKAALNQHIFKCLPKTKLYTDRFLQMAINGRLDEMIAKAHGGVGLQHITKGKLESLALPVPPLAEQHRIVTKVDELMALCDRLEASQEDREARRDRLVSASLARVTEPDSDDATSTATSARFHLDHFARLTTRPEHVKQLRQTILNLAVRGRLVPQDAAEGTALAVVTAAKIAIESTAGIRGKTSTGSGVVASRFPIPESWQWVALKNICTRVTSGATPPKDVFHETQGVPFLKVYNIRGQQVDFDYRPQFISETYHRERMRRSALLPGDVVMNIVGPPLGKVAVVPSCYPEWNCNQAIVLFRPAMAELSPYIYTYLCENGFLRDIELVGTAGQDNISVTKSQNIPIPLPPLAEQHRIVAKVDELMALCDRLEASLASAVTHRARLLEALLHEALAPAA